MKKWLGFVLLGLGAILGVIGALSAMYLAPLASIGPPGSVDYFFFALCYSPLAVAAVLLVVGFVVLLRPKTKSDLPRE